MGTRNTKGLLAVLFSKERAMVKIVLIFLYIFYKQAEQSETLREDAGESSRETER